MSKFWSSMVKRTVPYIPGEQIDQKDILKLNTNENPYPPSPKVTDAIKTELARGINLYPSPTVEQLRDAIASYNQLAKENVFVGNGSDEVLAFSFMAFFESGKAIRFPTVTYSFYPVYCKLFDIPYEEVPVQRDFSLQVEGFFQSEGGVIFPNPNAPTGVFLSLDDVASIVEQNSEQVVIIDEAYVDFATESAVSLIQTYPNLLVVQTTSKSRSLAGLRIGYALGQPELIEGLTRIKDSFNSYTIDRLAIAGAEASFRDKSYFKETTQKILQTRSWVSDELKQLGFHVIPSQANFIFVTHYKESATYLYQQFKKIGVLVRHFNKHPINNYLRITIGSDQDMKLFLTKAAQVLQ
ncbi:histidinol phosphate aminotransferase apoenzyme [Oceanobacillus limi]|uniref:Histidinol-phosphate aminotransferase n=1 Tax=Oceanobacillus limi TaxID=930131 RepID=A0A1I0AW27_9BACI|nr:histidinol-phosphate transaminase [Oceanobacillus limi]SES98582.1 histidinol phosphate aminotransferase apoenzyme [Oceanobacillus limi]